MIRLIEVLCLAAALFCFACGGGDGGGDEAVEDMAVEEITSDMAVEDVTVDEEVWNQSECVDMVCVDIVDTMETAAPLLDVAPDLGFDLPEEDIQQTDDQPSPDCGNGVLDPDEECDDGNNDPDDGCDEECMIEGVDPCGDGVCDKEAGECQDCSEDCGNCCGDDVCDDFEDCEFCPADCGGCAGDAFCTLEGSGEGELLCSVSVAASSAGEPKATGIQFNFSFDSAAVSFDRFHDTFCAGPDQCLDWNIPPQNSLQPSGHTVASQEVGDGAVKVLIFHGTQPTTEVSDAHLEGELVQGEAEIMEIVFKVEGLAVGETTDIEVYDMKATDKDASPMTMELKGALFVTSP